MHGPRFLGLLTQTTYMANACFKKIVLLLNQLLEIIDSIGVFDVGEYLLEDCCTDDIPDCYDSKIFLMFFVLHIYQLGKSYYIMWDLPIFDK